MSRKSWVFEPESIADRLVQTILSGSHGGDFDLAVVLGSGWGEVATLGKLSQEYNYCDWSCFPAGQIVGQEGRLLVVEIASWRILFFVGRFHCYQGLSAYQAAFPARLASALGCPRLLLTCAAGGINRSYLPGDFMLVEDHLNLLGDNPLRALSGDTFIDLSQLYHHSLYDRLMNNSGEFKSKVHRGVLAALSGPSYETPAEIRMLANMGADVVSMSTVPEAIMGRFLNMDVAAMAFISNPAAGLGPLLSHADVLVCGEQNTQSSVELISQLIATWQSGEERLPPGEFLSVTT